ncbi:response regulator [Pseudobacteroides cellulosolvens]|uniref:Stage 0 sporulation protein A homolog n=1 Tax=Pseudobacteroides cellulosolvens ATCC 35603 = DSM 2933 TaxID=398512 RepID=A0A0L6JMR5_9FIRM|nr:response regulator [Pseudobacteroides cellulosolvens]KNY27053.1 response regulator receiver protein [Pseudobacteroides cellulosolvens ATCC 35603 = DSM 2933]
MYSIILISNDNFGNSLKKELRKRKFKMFFSSKPKPGLDKAKTKRPDILIINYVFKGSFMLFDMIKEIRSDSTLKNSLVFILSENKDEFDKVLAIELGADEYMVKPVDINQILFKLKCLLRYKKNILH